MGIKYFLHQLQQTLQTTIQQSAGLQGLKGKSAGSGIATLLTAEGVHFPLTQHSYFHSFIPEKNVGCPLSFQLGATSDAQKPALADPE